MARVPDHVMVVFDEAYYEYVRHPDFPDTIDYVKQGRNAIVLRTFSKIYGLAGLRIGYGLTTPEIANYLEPDSSALQCEQPGPAGRVGGAGG